MNLFSFADELMKVGAMDPIIQKHAGGENMPSGLVGSDPMPAEADLIRPDEVSSRLPRTVSLKPAIVAATLGTVSQAKDPIDRIMFNRAYEGAR